MKFLTLKLVAALEAFHYSCRIHNLMLTGKKWVTFAAQFHPHVFPGRAGGKGVAAGTGYLGVVKIFRMNLLFHNLL
jgi:hypothetical protein